MNKIKWISIGVVGSLFAVSHIGMIGYIATREKEAPLPSVDLPVGPYTSYKVSVSDDGYAISYKANDPKTAYITKDINCLLYTSPSPRDTRSSRMPSSA